MPELTYEAIKPLLAEQKQNVSRLDCVFTCPETGVSVSSTAIITAGRAAKDVAKSAVKRGLFSSLRSAVSRTISKTLGANVASSAAHQVSSQMMSNAQRDASYSKTDVQAAAVKAFERVMDRFRWDADSGRWMGLRAAAAAETGFTRQLAAGPVTEKYDRGVMARMLTEIACIDGSVSDDEREFLSEFVDAEIGTVDELAEREPLSAVELSQVSEKARETTLMLAWSVALSDRDVADAEKARLDEMAAGLSIAEDRAAELRRHSAEYLLEQAFAVAYAGGSKDAAAHADAMALATGMGLLPQDAELADVRYRKHAGIV